MSGNVFQHRRIPEAAAGYYGEDESNHHDHGREKTPESNQNGFDFSLITRAPQKRLPSPILKTKVAPNDFDETEKDDFVVVKSNKSNLQIQGSQHSVSHVPSNKCETMGKSQPSIQPGNIVNGDNSSVQSNSKISCNHKTLPKCADTKSSGSTEEPPHQNPSSKRSRSSIPRKPLPSPVVGTKSSTTMPSISTNTIKSMKNSPTQENHSITVLHSAVKRPESCTSVKDCDQEEIFVNRTTSDRIKLSYPKQNEDGDGNVIPINPNAEEKLKKKPVYYKSKFWDFVVPKKNGEDRPSKPEKGKKYDQSRVRDFMEKQKEIRRSREKREEEDRQRAQEKKKLQLQELDKKRKNLMKPSATKKEPPITLAKVVPAPAPAPPAQEETTRTSYTRSSLTRLTPMKALRPSVTSNEESASVFRTSLILHEFENIVHNECLNVMKNHAERLKGLNSCVKVDKAVETTMSLFDDQETRPAQGFSTPLKSTIDIPLQQAVRRVSSGNIGAIRNSAATKIQSVYRGYKIRKALEAANLLPRKKSRSRRRSFYRASEKPVDTNVKNLIARSPPNLALSQDVFDRTCYIPPPPGYSPSRTTSLTTAKTPQSSRSSTVSRSLSSFDEPFPKEAIRRLQSRTGSPRETRRFSLEHHLIGNEFRPKAEPYSKPIENDRRLSDSFDYPLSLARPFDVRAMDIPVPTFSTVLREKIRILQEKLLKSTTQKPIAGQNKSRFPERLSQPRQRRTEEIRLYDSDTTSECSVIKTDPIKEGFLPKVSETSQSASKVSSIPPSASSQDEEPYEPDFESESASVSKLAKLAHKFEIRRRQRRTEEKHDLDPMSECSVKSASIKETFPSVSERSQPVSKSVSSQDEVSYEADFESESTIYVSKLAMLAHAFEIQRRNKEKHDSNNMSESSVKAAQIKDTFPPVSEASEPVSKSASSQDEIPYEPEFESEIEIEPRQRRTEEKHDSDTMSERSRKSELIKETLPPISETSQIGSKLSPIPPRTSSQDEIPYEPEFESEFEIEPRQRRTEEKHDSDSMSERSRKSELIKEALPPISETSQIGSKVSPISPRASSQDEIPYEPDFESLSKSLSKPSLSAKLVHQSVIQSQTAEIHDSDTMSECSIIKTEPIKEAFQLLSDKSQSGSKVTPIPPPASSQDEVPYEPDFESELEIQPQQYRTEEINDSATMSECSIIKTEPIKEAFPLISDTSQSVSKVSQVPTYAKLHDEGHEVPYEPDFESESSLSKPSQEVRTAHEVEIQSQKCPTEKINDSDTTSECSIIQTEPMKDAFLPLSETSQSEPIKDAFLSIPETSQSEPIKDAFLPIPETSQSEPIKDAFLPMAETSQSEPIKDTFLPMPETSQSGSKISPILPSSESSQDEELYEPDFESESLSLSKASLSAKSVHELEVKQTLDVQFQEQDTWKELVASGETVNKVAENILARLLSTVVQEERETTDGVQPHSVKSIQTRISEILKRIPDYSRPAEGDKQSWGSFFAPSLFVDEDIEDHAEEKLPDHEDEYFEDDLVSSSTDAAEEKTLLEEAAKNAEEQKRIDNEIRALLASREIPDKPPPPYGSPSSSGSSSLSQHARFFTISFDEHKLREIISWQLDNEWIFEDQTFKSLNVNTDSPPVDNFGVSTADKLSMVAARSFDALLLDTARKIIPEVLQIDSEINKPFIDKIRPGSLALTAQRQRIPRSREQLIPIVFKKFLEVIPTDLAMETMSPNLPIKKQMPKWTCRCRDMVDDVLVEELPEEERDWTEFWPEEILVIERVKERTLRRAIREVLNDFQTVFG